MAGNVTQMGGTVTAEPLASSPVSLEIVEGTALVAIDNPPVNAASQAVRAGLLAALEAADRRDDIDVVVLYGRGRTFVAGADIREFGKPPQAPILTEVCSFIEARKTPVIAVLHGTALGGGLELALAAHARVVLPGTQLGLPEVTLGILPGAGGTQRTPRLIGIARALEIVTTGRRIPAEEALAIGLVDRIEEGEVREVALRAAAAVRDGALATRRSGELPVEPDETAVEEARARLAMSQPNLFSPHKCVEAVAASVRPLEEGLAQERALFRECLDSPQRAGLIHAFFAERAVTKIPEADAQPRPVERIGVIGGGTMGSGIATAALLAGLKVTLTERDEPALERGRATVAQNLAQSVKRGSLTEARRVELLERHLATSVGLEGLTLADLVIEAVFEDMAVKREVFARLDAIAKPGAILATNTSYLDVDAVAAATGRPQDVIGLHFFSPAHVMRLLEVVVGARTAPDVVATGFALAKRLRKVPVRAGVCDGFIGNRILTHYKKVLDYLVMDGATPEAVDRAVTAFGFAMGPFAVSDLAGLDIGWAARKRRAPERPPEERYVAIADRICEQGWLGRKTGRGFYVYPKDGAPYPNPQVDSILAEERAKAGVRPRSIEDAEIVARLTTAMISEGARVLEEGIAQRPIDIDAVFLFGYGFPRFRGGPMHYADTLGAAELVRRIERYALEDAHYWQVPALLARMARDGGRFSEMNED